MSARYYVSLSLNTVNYYLSVKYLHSAWFLDGRTSIFITITMVGFATWTFLCYQCKGAQVTRPNMVIVEQGGQITISIMKYQVRLIYINFFTLANIS